MLLRIKQATAKAPEARQHTQESIYAQSGTRTGGGRLQESVGAVRVCIIVPSMCAQQVYMLHV